MSMALNLQAAIHTCRKRTMHFASPNAPDSAAAQQPRPLGPRYMRWLPLTQVGGDEH